MLISLIPARRDGYLLSHCEWSEIFLLDWDYEFLTISFLTFLIAQNDKIYLLAWQNLDGPKNFF